MPKELKYLPELQYNPTVHRKISQIVGGEISNFAKPCYYPKLVRYFKDIKSWLGITDNQIRMFISQNLGPKYRSMSIIKDTQTILIVMAIIYFLRASKRDISSLFYQFLALKFQYNLMHRQFKYCNPDIFAMALEHISHRHLYKTQGGIPSTISYLAAAEYKRYSKILGGPKLTDKNIVNFTYALRTRLSQSIKSFADAYYKIAAPGGARLRRDEEETTEDKLENISDKLVMNMTTYGNIDKAALIEAINVSGLRKELSVKIISELSVPEYKDQLKYIIKLMHRLGDLRSVCIKSKRLSLIRKISSGQKVGGHSLRDQFLKLFKQIPSAHCLTSIYDQQLVIFACHYFTLYFRGRIC